MKSFLVHEIVDPHVVHEELVGQLGLGDVAAPLAYFVAELNIRSPDTPRKSSVF